MNMLDFKDMDGKWHAIHVTHSAPKKGSAT